MKYRVYWIRERDGRRGEDYLPFARQMDAERHCAFQNEYYGRQFIFYVREVTP